MKTKSHVATHDSLSTQQKKHHQLKNELVSTDYTSTVGEKQFSDMQKGCKTKRLENSVVDLRASEYTV